MKIRRKSPVTGNENVMDLPITADDILRIGLNVIHHGVNNHRIRTVCPHLSEVEIQFYLTGKIAEEQTSHENEGSV